MYMKLKSILTVLAGVISIVGVSFCLFLLTNEDVEEEKKEQVVEEIELEETDESEHLDEVNNEELTNEVDNSSSSVEDHQEDVHSSHEEEHSHSHSHGTAEEYQAEDIISGYFAAITLGNSNTLNELFPAGKTENEQLAILLQNSTIVADIVDMKKVSIDNKKAEYTVVVKLHTRQPDENFTDNKTTYKLVLDLAGGVITSKTTVGTEYLE